MGNWCGGLQLLVATGHHFTRCPPPSAHPRLGCTSQLGVLEYLTTPPLRGLGKWRCHHPGVSTTTTDEWASDHTPRGGPGLHSSILHHASHLAHKPQKTHHQAFRPPRPLVSCHAAHRPPYRGPNPDGHTPSCLLRQQGAAFSW